MTGADARDTVVGMDTLIYFVTVFPMGIAYLAAMWVRDSKVVPVGQNFMPTMDEMKDFI